MSPISRTVYGIYYPETRRIVDALWRELPHADYERNYTGRQDSMHHALLSGWRRWAAAAGVTLGAGYAQEYPTAGANEAIHAILALHAAARGSETGRGRVHVFEGEYEGYIYTGEALGLEVIRHARDPERYSDSLARLARPRDLFFISQPSAIDGNLWPRFSEFRETLVAVAPGVELVVDVTYVGATAVEPRIDLDHDAVRAVVWSLSKPFGVYYHRIGGVVSRTEIPTLRGHHWFKNLFSVRLGERLIATHSARDLPARYASHQAASVERGRQDGLLPDRARPSDVVMLAHAPGADHDGPYAPYARGDGLRFCLSPAIDGAINP